MKFRTVIITIILISILSSLAQDGLFQPEVKVSKTKADNKSMLKAVGLSLLIPGTGEYYLGSKRSYIFWTAEAGIWISYAGFLTHSSMLEDEYKAFATEHAGVTTSGKNKEFFERIGQWDSRYEYNLLTGLSEHSEENLYPETQEYFWEWDSEENMSEYADMRVQSDTDIRNSSIILACAGINRLISVIDVIRMSTYKVPDTESNKLFSMNLYTQPGGYNRDKITYKFSLTREF